MTTWVGQYITYPRSFPFPFHSFASIPKRPFHSEKDFKHNQLAHEVPECAHPKLMIYRMFGHL